MLSITGINFSQNTKNNVRSKHNTPVIKMHSQLLKDEVSFKGSQKIDLLELMGVTSSFTNGFGKTSKLLGNVANLFLLPKQKHLDVMRSIAIKEVESIGGLSTKSIPRFQAILSETAPDGKVVTLKRLSNTKSYEISVTKPDDLTYVENYYLSKKGIGLNVNTEKNTNFPKDAFDTSENTRNTFDQATKNANSALQLIIDNNTKRVNDHLKGITGIIDSINELFNAFTGIL